MVYWHKTPTILAETLACMWFTIFFMIFIRELVSNLFQNLSDSKSFQPLTQQVSKLENNHIFSLEIGSPPQKKERGNHGNGIFYYIYPHEWWIFYGKWTWKPRCSHVFFWFETFPAAPQCAGNAMSDPNQNSDGSPIGSPDASPVPPGRTCLHCIWCLGFATSYPTWAEHSSWWIYQINCWYQSGSWGWMMG